MKSIRLYLIIVLLSTICLLNFVAALHGYRGSMAQADKLLDKQLSDFASLLSKLDFVGPGLNAETSNGTRLEPAYRLGEYSHTWHPQIIHPQIMMFQIWQGEHLLERSSNASEMPLLPLESGFYVKNYQNLRWRILVYKADDVVESGRWIIVGQRADAYTTLIESIIFQSIWPIIWVLPVLGVAIWLIISFGLRPLRQLAQLLRQRKIDELAPLAETGYPGELSTLIESTNSLLARLSDALERERRFASDAAHELRTPLAVLKVNLHNLAEEVGLDSASLEALEASVDRMNHSIEQILALYRLTPDKFHSTLSRIDIGVLARTVIADLYPRWDQKNQQVTLEAEVCNVECDTFAISTLLRNLIDNASKYSPAGGRILVSIIISEASQITGQKRVLITVEDSGPGIPAASRGRVFDRFYRLGGDQHHSGVVGCGLGLSIVDHIVGLHGGKIELGQSKMLGGLCVSVLLPCEQGHSGDLIND